MKKYFLLLITLFFCLNVKAQQSLEIVVPFPAGGPVDVFARNFQKYLLINNVQSVVVNKPGADARIALKYIKSKPEGSNTIFVATSGSFLFNKILLQNNEHDFDEFNSILPIARTPLAIAVSKDSGITSWQDFLVKAKNNKINCGVSNPASRFIARYLLNQFALSETVIIPFKGSNDLLPNLVGNNVDCGIDTLVLFAAPHKINRVRMIVLGTSTENNEFNLPTIAESLKGFEFYNWFGLAVYKNHRVDKKVIDLAYNSFKDKTFVENLKNIEFEVIKPPVDVLNFLNTEFNRFDKIRIQLGIEKATY